MLKVWFNRCKRSGAMLSTTRIWTLGLLVLGMKGSFVQAHNDGYHAQNPSTKVVYETTTRYHQSLVKEVDTVTYTVPTTTTDITTVPTTTTVHTTQTVVTTDTCTVTDTTTVPTTVTVHVMATVITTLTATATDTTTIPTTTTITSTITLFPTLTDTSTSTFYDPCPKSCSISVDSVTLVYWPTRYPNVTYPATYVDPTIAYTFTSPSVYYIINTMVGTNGAGRVPGKDAHSTIYPFNLNEVSTLVLPEQTETRQLTLNDLGTACPRSLDASVIVTKLRDSVCDPVLAAPYRIRSWAFPCNACGPFGLFDPPYAVPTLPGGLLGPTTVPVISATAAPTQAPPPPPPPASTAAPPPPPPPASSAPPPPPPAPTTPPAPAPTVTPPSSATSVVPVQTALAPKMTGETGFMIMSLFVSMFLLF